MPDKLSRALALRNVTRTSDKMSASGMLMLAAIILVITAFDVILWINIHSYSHASSEREGVTNAVVKKVDKN